MFRMRLDYRYAGQGISTESFNGNIAKIEWSDYDYWVHEMDMEYDDLNRLKYSARIEYEFGEWIYNTQIWIFGIIT
jgi:hypothetical protein